MTTLREVLISFNLNKPSMQIGFVQLAAYRGGLFDIGFKNQVITDEIVNQLLDSPFEESLESARLKLCLYTEKNWLRQTFKDEGAASNNDPVIHLIRWLEKEDKAIDDQAKLFSIFRKLELVDEVKWPEEKVSHVVLHGALEEHASERINSLSDFDGELVYVTNPRMLFNWEPSFAPIVASWFDNWADRQEEAIQRIQSVLEKHKDLKSSDKNWLKDPQGLKQLILEVLGERVWPKKGWYYQNPVPYEEAAKNEKRPTPEGLPTAMDMIEYLFNQLKKQYPDRFNHITLRPVYSVRAGRVATTEDNMEDWYELYGKHLPVDTTIVFVSNNSKGLHYIGYQDFQMKNTLSRMGKIPGMIANKAITVGKGASEIKLSSATDIFAKMFFSQLSYVERNQLKTNLRGVTSLPAKPKVEDEKGHENLKAPRKEGMFGGAGSEGAGELNKTVASNNTVSLVV